MNGDQRAVLAAIARMEGRPGTLIDEYTVAREAGILTSDLAGHDYVASPGREMIRRHLGELERAELIRLDRDGFWRPRTTLAGRRVLQGIPPLVAPLRPNDFPEWSEVGGPRQQATESASIPAFLRDDDDIDDLPARQEERGWPTWWPAALRVGDPSLTPLIVPIIGIVVLLICVFVGARMISARSGAATPTPTVEAVASPTPGNGSVAGGGPGASPSGAPANSPSAAAAPPTRTPTPKPAGPPTATAKPQSKQVMIANTDNKGAALYATPKGERKTLAIPEGIIVDVVGPDERDSTGANWKHIAWADGDYWVPEEYTEPVN